MRVLKREPLKYNVISQTGSHRKLESATGYPPIDFCFHDQDTVPPGLVRQVLVKRVGLDEAAAIRLI